MNGGDCLSCEKIITCTETSFAKVVDCYTCPLFIPIPYAVYLARLEMINRYGEEIAIGAMLSRPDSLSEEELI